VCLSGLDQSEATLTGRAPHRTRIWSSVSQDASCNRQWLVPSDDSNGHRRKSDRQTRSCCGHSLAHLSAFVHERCEVRLEAAQKDSENCKRSSDRNLRLCMNSVDKGGKRRNRDTNAAISIHWLAKMEMKAEQISAYFMLEV
jgi:hypothetical protein